MFSYHCFRAAGNVSFSHSNDWKRLTAVHSSLQANIGLEYYFSNQYFSDAAEYESECDGGFSFGELHLIVQVHHVGFHLRVGLAQLVNLFVELFDVFIVVQN